MTSHQMTSTPVGEPSRSARFGGIWLVATALVLLAALGLSCPAASYYVDGLYGNDANPGSLAAPWKTLAKAAHTMVSGDTAYVRAGTYRETVYPRDGQTFAAYPGEKPLITGCDPVTNWTVHFGSIYKATVNTKVYDVFVGTNSMPKARWPNFDGDYQSDATWASATNWLVSSSGTGTGKVRFLADTPPGCVGGWYSGLHGRNHWNACEGRITAVSGNEITCTDLQDTYQWTAASHSGSGRGYIIHHLNCLDAEGEWHWEDYRLYFWPPGGGIPTNVWARTRLYGFVLTNRSHVTLQGLYFFAASALVEGGTGNVIDGCHFRHVSPWGNTRYSGVRYPLDWGGTADGTSGLHVSGTAHSVRNCSVVGGWANGIRLDGGFDLSVSNNYVADFGWIGRQAMAPISGFGTNLYIGRNTVRRSANTGLFIAQKSIDPSTPTNLVKQAYVVHNDVRDVGYLLDDSGHCFMYLANGDAPSALRSLDGEIAYNLCVGLQKSKDQTGGIYLDNGTDYCTIHHNVVNCLPGMARSGIVLNAAGHLQENIFCYHNLLWGYKNGGWGAAIMSGASSATPGRTNLVFRNNLAQYTRYAGVNWDTLSWTMDGITASHNRTDVPASEFVDVPSSNFRLNSTATNSINKGMVIAGINDAGSASPYAGSAPDLGAYEYGGVDWTAGSTISAPPPFPPVEGLGPSPPAAPSDLKAMAVSPTQINLSWADNAANETGFILQRKPGAGGAWGPIAALGADATNYLDAGLLPNTTYFYRVAATNLAGASAWSQEVSATTLSAVAAWFTGWGWQSDGTLRLRATGGVGQSYVLEAATNLNPPILWEGIATNTADGGALEFLDPNATHHPQRYYRAVTP